VCLPARGVSQAAGKRCTVTGYGYMGEGKQQVCSNSWGNMSSKYAVIHGGMRAASMQ
jgi:hypothetical protein